MRDQRGKRANTGNYMQPVSIDGRAYFLVRQKYQPG